MNKPVALLIAILLIPFNAAQAADPDGTTVIESGGRRVVFTDEVPVERTGYDSPWHYAHAVRAGDFVYVSGVIIGARPDESLPVDAPRFRELTEGVFDILGKYLATAGAGLGDVVKINTFHVLDEEVSSLRIDEQALIIAETRDRHAVEPHPAWTAVGTTGLFSPRGIVEIEIVAYAPKNN